MARKRYSDEDILKLLREIDIHLHDGLGQGILFSRLLFVMLESPPHMGFYYTPYMQVVRGLDDLARVPWSEQN